jgi:hypothetical protein
MLLHKTVMNGASNHIQDGSRQYLASERGYGSDQEVFSNKYGSRTLDMVKRENSSLMPRGSF